MAAIVVQPNQVGGWSVKRSGARRALKRFPTKEAAVSYAKRICGETGESIYILTEAGGISMKYEYRRT